MTTITLPALPYGYDDLAPHITRETLEYNCSWDLDHIIPVSWATTNEELYMLNHWSNFQPLCSKINRDDKKSNIYPCTNIQLMITFGKKN